jgi:hypothetical protein
VSKGSGSAVVFWTGITHLLIAFCWIDIKINIEVNKLKSIRCGSILRNVIKHYSNLTISIFAIFCVLSIYFASEIRNDSNLTDQPQKLKLQFKTTFNSQQLPKVFFEDYFSSNSCNMDQQSDSNVNRLEPEPTEVSIDKEVERILASMCVAVPRMISPLRDPMWVQLWFLELLLIIFFHRTQVNRPSSQETPQRTEEAPAHAEAVKKEQQQQHKWPRPLILFNCNFSHLLNSNKKSKPERRGLKEHQM